MGGNWYTPTLFYGFELDEDVLWSWLKANKKYQDYVDASLFTHKICLDEDVVALLEEYINLQGLEIVNFLPSVYSRWNEEVPKWDEYLQNSILVGKRIPEPLTLKSISSVNLPSREKIVSIFSFISHDLVQGGEAAFYNGFLI